MNIIKKLLARARKMARNVGDAFKDEKTKETRMKKEQENLNLNTNGIPEQEYGMGQEARERRAAERYNSPEAVERREKSRLRKNEKARVNYLSERFEEAMEYLSTADVALENINRAKIDEWMNTEEDELSEEERQRQLYYEETTEVLTEKINEKYEKFPELRPLEEQLDDIIIKG